MINSETKIMRESNLRSLAKAVSWRIFGSLITTGISYLLTRQFLFSIYIGAFEFFSKIIFFYLHERMWENISFLSRKKITAINVNQGE